MPVPSRTIISALFIGIIFVTLFVFRNLATALILGLIVAVIINPFYQRVRKLFKKHDSLSALVVVLLIFGMMIGPAVALLFLALNEMTVALSSFLTFIDQTGFDLSTAGSIIVVLEEFGIDTKTILISHVIPLLNQIGGSFSKIFLEFFSNLPRIFLDFFLMLVGLFFFLKDGKQIRSFFFQILPLSEKESSHLAETFNDVILAIFWGQFLTAIAQGVLGGLGFYLFGFGAPVFLGILMTFASLIPFIGPAIVYLPATLYLFVSGAAAPAVLLFLSYNLFVVSSVDNLVKPLVIGSKVKIHPALIFFSLIGGLRFFGPLGIIYGPLIVALFLLLSDLYLEKTRQQSLFDHD
ncbi:MAG: hypothetical protein UX26_C0019G0007 [Parcubacteria group bacterium GW2011_GWC1_45_9]|uniref:Permease n=1 Tax=Candidatus Woesebacteria bacterium GW2011_GWB1_39_12 TaxID=1618574 RepID=A0A0G0PHU1_9BACT|nr:MAG: hypothetical protein UT24_C0045G0007 [Candidatus Woesebacteria bacterium GW2011_GWB1_39_12]KKU16655.1 MAG: hypothetical protein UX26_C0019G0007 [Parcubacteria group bacterium GW2011_GWC1_45_9]